MEKEIVRFDRDTFGLNSFLCTEEGPSNDSRSNFNKRLGNSTRFTITNVMSVVLKVRPSTLLKF